MVSPEGACAAYYNYGRLARRRRWCDGAPGGEGDGVAVRADREERILGIIETARAKRPRVP